MHPAYSVIFFTTSSGAGYGLLFWLGLAEAAGALPDGRWFAFIALAIAMALITAGLLSSTLHLGRPERALGAFSQWRSSWLSREGVAAVVTYIPAGLLGLIWLFGIDSGWSGMLGILSAIGAAITVYCTGMIYGSLRTIRQWSHMLVRWVYLAMAAGTGGLLLILLLGLAGHGLPIWAGLLAFFSMGAAAILKLEYWLEVDKDPGQYTAEMALGLGDLGKVRPLDPPHTKPNFVMREMGYSVARKHAMKLRLISTAALFVAAPLLVLLAILTAGAISTLILLIAVALAGLGVVTERWLFFAEAEHVSQLYYGRDRA